MPKKRSRKNVNKSLSEAAARLGQAGGKVGGKMRALKLSKAQRVEIAKEGARAKHAKDKKKKGSK